MVWVAEAGLLMSVIKLFPCRLSTYGRISRDLLAMTFFPRRTMVHDLNYCEYYANQIHLNVVLLSNGFYSSAMFATEGRLLHS